MSQSKEKKKGARLPCKHKGSTNQLHAHSAGGRAGGRARGRAGQWHVPGRPAVFRQTQKGKCKETQLICILLLFHGRQNVLEHKVLTESPTEVIYLLIECKKKGGVEEMPIREQHQLETSIM